MTKKDRERVKIMDTVIKEYISLKDTAEFLNINYRQAKRINDK